MSMWEAFKAYGLGNRDAFETMNNQLFESYIRRIHATDLQKFRVINGSGGDGGVEAYALLTNGEYVGLQSKWFRSSIADGEITQIKKSILTAKKIRPGLKEYIICIPHDVHSTKIGRGKKTINNSEEDRINKLIDEAHALHPDLTLTWWFDHEILEELQHPDNTGVHKYWFEKEVITQQYLKDQFQLQMQNDWLKQRYTPNLHGLGIINERYQQMILGKQYRKELSDVLQEMLNILERCNKQIKIFLATGQPTTALKTSLDALSINLSEYSEQLILFQEAVNTGNESFKPKLVKEVKVSPVLSQLNGITEAHSLKRILPELKNLLQKVHEENLEEFLTSFARHLNERVKMVRGSAGGGKTHGLANCVDEHLKNNLPAVIMPAKNTPCVNWSTILSHALELPGWTREEIFSALEACAISIDIGKAKALPAGKELNEPLTKALICIDGLEEEAGKESDWCSRVAEVAVLAHKYPRIRFLFSARDYFRRDCIDAYNNCWEEVDLPSEGDIPVWEVAEDYLKAYDIKLEYAAAIKGLDSLLALRLFCEQYKGKTIRSADDIATAARDLLRMKVDKINKEFLASLQQQKGATQHPVLQALLALAEHYYYTPEATHDELRELILKKTGAILSASEVDLLLDYLVNNGILIRYPRTDNTGPIATTVHYYRITYQSIIEHILSEKIYQDIKNEKIETIPEILHHPITRSLDPPREEELFEEPPNQRITQDLVTRLFAESGKLIGEDGFLVKGFSTEQIRQMQLRALANAPKDKAIAFKDKVDRLYFGTRQEQFEALNFVIIPSCERPDSAFGTEYLHDILISQTSAFERDKLWSGLDSHEANLRKKEMVNPVKDALQGDVGRIHLSEFESYNERPLLFAWALSNIDQRFRNNLRVALTGWAIKRPEEFLKLLDKLFDCNDPQIQEDLSSVMLGVAGQISDKDHLQSLANWALTNVFEKKAIHRNVIVRQGFRVIVERAALFGAITQEQAAKARPAPLKEIQLLDLEEKLETGHGGESYPIMHDLAWYVIEKAYDNFLEYPSQTGEDVEDNDCEEAKELLDRYREKYANPGIFAKGWVMAAAIHYIKNRLGLTREDGNSWTGETHGAKSKVYTYEEKYTWLAVHYLQGYLSDYVPLGSIGSDIREWVEDYTQLTEIPNPGEEILSEEKIAKIIEGEDGWMIKEDLAPTISLEGDIGVNIKQWVEQEPTPDFSKWLEFDNADFPSKGNGEKRWQTLYNHTTLLEASEAGYSRLDATACLVKESDFETIKKLFEDKKDQVLFQLRDTDHLTASPNTSTYSNPSDIVWMDWIKENNEGCSIETKGKEIEVTYTVTQVTQNTVDGEKYYRIPSKTVRKMMDIRSYNEPRFFDSTGNLMAFTHTKSDGSYRDSQELLLVESDVLTRKQEENQQQLFWIVELFKRKNSLNKNLESYDHYQRTRKYLVWKEGNQYHSIKYWDERFSNQRDKK